jgi:hypothetical protein
MHSPDVHRTKIRPGALIAFALGAMLSVAVADSPPPEPPPETETSALTPILLTVLAIEPRAYALDAPELCEDKPGGAAWIDRVQAGLYRTMCLTSARFDGFFGNARFDDEYQATHGSVAVGTQWDERDHWDPSLRFRVSLRLPQLSERFNAFIGRLDPDEYVTDARDDFDTLPRQFAGEPDDQLLLGLGYRQPGRRGGYFDGSVGAKFDWPPEPYAKGAYHLTLPFLDRNLLRINETIFWREDEGFGTTARLDIDRLLTEAFLVRWTGSGTFSEDTEGVRWYSTVTLYQNLGSVRAFAYQAAISGETDHEVDIGDYGFRVIYRRRLHRDWLFLELRSSITWPRETLLERREPNWGAGAAVELQFGERRKK